MDPPVRRDIRRRRRGRAALQHHRLEQQLHGAAADRRRDAGAGRFDGRQNPGAPAAAHSGIGCGTGLLLHQLAPACREYRATDFSQVAVSYVSAGLDGLPHVEVWKAEADDFSRVARAHSMSSCSIRSFNAFGKRLSGACAASGGRRSSAWRACLCRRPPQPGALGGISCFGRSGARRVRTAAGGTRVTGCGAACGWNPSSSSRLTSCCTSVASACDHEGRSSSAARMVGQ